MLRFRSPPPNPVPGSVTDLLVVGQLIDDVMQPGHFFVAPELRLMWIAARAETISWEIFRGRLLDASQTRAQKTFLSWQVIQEEAAEPMISVKLDVHERQVHVTRGLLSYVWEGYDSGGGVIESRETVKWARELVGTIALADYADLENVRDELICLVWQAIVGTSRLPLTSVEAPLPAFSFGQLHYVYRTDAAEDPMTSWEELLPVGRGPALAWQEMVKVVEFILRLDGTDDVTVLRLVDLKIRLEQISGLPLMALWREMFNSASLSPHTSFVFSALKVIEFGLWREREIDFHSLLVRQLCRHLTAYDLVTFHHRGANYPDALLLEEVLDRFATSAAIFPELFLGNEPTARMRRRALRQGCLMRRQYEGHLVPDLPTSPGENARVLPVSHPRVPEEQLLQPHRRRRVLFGKSSPLHMLYAGPGCTVLAQSVADLEHLDQRVEMGLGLFIDRPLGYAKAIGEPDLTPLLAHEAFSPSLARRRWQELKKLCTELAIPFDPALDALFENGPWPDGLPHVELAGCPRPMAALADVRKVADDFTILRTRPVGLLRMLGYFELIQTLRARYRLEFLDAGQSPRLCVQAFHEAQEPRLFLFDEQLRRRVEIVVDVSQGYRTRAGIELPKAGLRVVRVWEDTDEPAVLARRDVEEID